MRSSILVIGLAFGLAVSPRQVQAQGTVSFAGAVVMTYDWRGQPSGKISPASDFTFGLYLGTTAAGAQSSTTPAFVITPAANAFPGTISSATQTISGHPTGETDYFVIKGWNGGAASYEIGLSTGTSFISGVSAVGQITTGLGGGSAPPFFLFTGPGGIGANGLIFTPVPEPTAFQLGGVALAAIAFFARPAKSSGGRKLRPMRP